MIKVLDQATINKIAAGEVVERPSSVVKELVENAIDAGATAVTVEIKDGGMSFIRITDNGVGIPKEEVPTAFIRHATSKIMTIEDLLSVSSLGFRGEALASIAAVAQVECITKTSHALTGLRYEIHGSKEIASEEIGAPTGTTIIVRNLFYNVPARKKFLKTAMTEGSYVTELLTRLSLSHPEVSFKYIINGNNKIATSGNNKLQDVIYHIYGKDVSGNLLPLKRSVGEFTVEGYIGKAYVSKGNRSFEHYFVNGRYIRSNIITKAIEEAYKSFVMVHKFPFTALHFTLDSNKLDVNVHPTKMEFKYADGEQLFDFVKTSVRETLLSQEMIQDVSLRTAKEERAITIEQQKKVTANVPEPFENKARALRYQQGVTSHKNEENGLKINDTATNNQVVSNDLISDNTQAVTSNTPNKNTQKLTNNVTFDKAQVKTSDISATNTQTTEKSLRATSIQTTEKSLPNTSAQTTEKTLHAASVQTTETSLRNTSAQTTEKTLHAASAQTTENSLLHATSAQTSENSLRATSAQTTENSLRATSAQTTENSLCDTSAQTTENNLHATSAQTTDNSLSTTDSANLQITQNALVNTNQSEVQTSNPETSNPSVVHEQLSMPMEQFISEEARKKHRLIGQVFKTYWMIEYDEKMYIVDQHAAHEKVMFERLMKQMANKKVLSQQLLPPKVLHLDNIEHTTVMNHIDLFEQTGFDIEDFGDDSIVVRAMPDDIMGVDPQLLFDALLNALTEDIGKISIDFFVEKLSGMACKAAIKGNTEISTMEADTLIDEMLTLDNPYNCPHGRPTMIALTKGEIERKFKRIQD